MDLPKYAIYDSLDRRACRPVDNARALYDLCEALSLESEAEGSRLTYAIGMIMPDGETTFDFG